MKETAKVVERERVGAGMSKAIEELLDATAKYCCLATTGKVESGDLAAIRFTLRQRIEPLLEAGQAMRYANGHDEFTSGCTVCMANLLWDKVLAGKGQA